MSGDALARFRATSGEVTGTADAGAVTAEQKRIAELEAQLAGAQKAAQQGGQAEGWDPAAINQITSILSMFGGGGEGDMDIGSYIKKYHGQGAGIDFQIVPGEMGLGTLMPLLNDNGPIQIPQEVFQGAAAAAITQIINDPSILQGLADSSNDSTPMAPELKTALLKLQVHLIAAGEDSAKKQDLTTQLILMMQSQENTLGLSPEETAALEGQVTQMVGQTIAGGIVDARMRLQDSPIMGMIQDAIGMVEQTLAGFGLNLNLQQMIS